MGSIYVYVRLPLLQACRSSGVMSRAIENLKNLKKNVVVKLNLKSVQRAIFLGECMFRVKLSSTINPKKQVSLSKKMLRKRKKSMAIATVFIIFSSLFQYRSYNPFAFVKHLLL